MNGFRGGIALCEAFFSHAAKPILDAEFPGLKYSAGLIGYGSDVLGYDDLVSIDHMWGPRFNLFLRPDDMPLSGKIMNAFSHKLPVSFEGWSVNFSAPDPNDNGVRCAELLEHGPVSPLIFISTIDSFFRKYPGASDFAALTPADWLSFSEHKLLAATAGKIFHDDLGISEKRRQIAYFPDMIWHYHIASQWALIGEEQAFVKRTSSRGDDAGSRIICARIMDRLMRLCFLYSRVYAPYSKWYGTAFARLPIDLAIGNSINAALSASDWHRREDLCVKAQSLVAALHNSAGLTEPVSVEITQYFGRDIKVIYVDRIAAAVRKLLIGTPLESAALIGSLCQTGNLVELTEDSAYRGRILSLYQ